MYYPRLIDKDLLRWKNHPLHKPLLLRGARQVGKSSAVRNLGKSFPRFIEVNFEKEPMLKQIFTQNLDPVRIVRELGAIKGSAIVPGETLLFLDEIQVCQEAIMALRFFKEELPDLHVIGAGSLLELALAELPTFGVGRIHSMYMYPMSFDEFLDAEGQQLLIEAKEEATPANPLPQLLHRQLIGFFRSYLLVGGMPEAVATWVKTHDYLLCREIQDDIVSGYQDDFPKYRKKVDPLLLRLTLRSACVQCGSKFVYAEVGGGFPASEVKKALEMLILAGLLVPVVRTAANGVPLGAEADYSIRKILPLDTGLMLRMLALDKIDVTKITQDVLLSPPEDLVNKGPLAEMTAGLELLRYSSPDVHQELFYWQRDSRNSQAEIDYLTVRESRLLPVEVKAGMRGGMKSLWIFMREKKLTEGIRMSLENFGQFNYEDPECEGAIRKVGICPLYAVSNLSKDKYIIC